MTLKINPNHGVNFVDSILTISNEPTQGERVVNMIDEEYEHLKKETEKRLYMELWNELDDESREAIWHNQLLYYQRKSKANSATLSSPSSLPPT
jgi:hypothetical protein